MCANAQLHSNIKIMLIKENNLKQKLGLRNIPQQRVGLVQKNEQKFIA
jgi:hypothetical protein